MANFAITKFCQKHCAYCFIPNEWRHVTSAAQEIMTLKEFSTGCEMLHRGGRTSLSLLGGEPTTHPQFLTFVDYALNLGFAVCVVTNGEISDQQLEQLSRYSREQVTLLVNLAGNVRGKTAPTGRQKATLEKIGELVSLSFTIGDKLPDVSLWIDLIKSYGLDHHIRIGIAHPSPDMQNRSLLPSDRPRVGQNLVQIARRLHDNGISLGLDCGLTPCMFTDSSLEELKKLGVHSPFVCGPIPDIGPGLEAWHCFPTYDLVRCKLTDFESLDQANAWLAEHTKPYRLVGIHEECISCPHQLRRECSGGCLGYTIASFNEPLFQAATPN